ncbi:divergent polysaccharide deacetylase family protein [Alteromonadaceae bacterium BrNp21-10]|nr:divergent polysaccharide deacetylase family protein [Alteromonadaceae bacterium BrNp21-10]
MRKILFSLFLLIALALPALQAAEIALIIDDIGNSRNDESAFLLPKEVTFSILPHTPFSNEFAHRAAKQQREVMLHMPMESLAGTNPGPGAITSSMSPQAIQHKLSRAIEDIPNALGLNNHMGSKLTQLTLPMTTTMEFLQQRDMYFLDSRTTRYSKAEKIAHKVGVEVLHRNVFIDHSLDPAKMQKEFQRLVRIAKKYRKAIGIAHPNSTTMHFLQQNLHQLAEHNITLVPISRFLSKKGIYSQNVRLNR